MAHPTNVPLPPEMLFQILSYIPPQAQSQSILYAACLVSRSWYAVAVPFLYRRPYITSKNFKKFVATVCPSINAHIRKSELADMVRVLDMGNLVHDGSKSLTARLLGRVKEGVEEVRAPQASFALNSLAALSKCHSLRHLDLSLISESLSLPSLFHSLRSLTNLTSFHFPRSSYDSSDVKVALQWPPSLKELYLSGDLHDDALVYFAALPSSVVKLEIDNCLHLSGDFIVKLLSLMGQSLQSLKVGWNMPKVRQGSMDYILPLVPNLTTLNVSIEFLSLAFFDYAAQYSPAPHPLSNLTLDNSDRNFVLPEALWFAISDGGLGRMRRLRFTGIVGWAGSAESKEILEELGELLEALEREEGGGLGKDVKAGVWVSHDEGEGSLGVLQRLRGRADS